MNRIYFILAFSFLMVHSISAQVVGTYTGITYLTSLTGPCSAATLNVLGDNDLTGNGTYEIAYGSLFSGTWASGVGYSDGPGAEILCVSLHTEESWDVALRLSDGTTTATVNANMVTILDNVIWNMSDCGGTPTPGWDYDRRVAEVDFASYTIPAGVTVIGATFTLATDNAGNCDPVGMILFDGNTVVTTPPTIANNGPLCSGQDLNLTATSTDPAATFSWAGPNGFVSTLEDPTITGITALGAGDYTCAVTESDGTVYNLTTTFVINPQPAGNITFAAACEDIAMNFGFTSSSAAVISTYVWNFGVGLPATAATQNASSTYSTSGTHPVSLVLTSNLGCVTTIDTTVTIGQAPVPTFTVGSPLACEPIQFVLTNTTDPAQTATTHWLISDGQEFFNTNNVITAPMNAGDYDVQLIVTSPQGCVGSVTLTDVFPFVAQPIANFTWSPSPVLMFNTEVLLKNTSIGGTSYQWIIAGGLPGLATTEDVLATFQEGVVANYDVTLIVTSAAGCTDTVTKIISVLPEIIIYAPNTFTPDGDEFNQSWRIFMEGIDVYDFELLVFNRWGEIVWESHDPAGEWDGSYHGKLVPNGEYTWTVRTKSIIDDGKFEYFGHVFVNR